MNTEESTARIFQCWRVLYLLCDIESSNSCFVRNKSEHRPTGKKQIQPIK